MDSNIVVQKYGGSSLSNPDKICNVANRIAKRVLEGYRIITVVSAMGNTTDDLLELSKQISGEPDPREMDMLLATGEQISASLLAMALKNLNITSKSLNGFQAGIITTDDFTDARIQRMDSDKITSNFKDYKVIVITGFQGITENGEFTTLGRGGSDTSAVALSATLGVPCEIYSDVDGIYSVDPKIYPYAKKRKYISYDEMLEMSSLGSEVLHSRSIEIAKKYNVPIYCASSFNDEEGSFVVSADQIIEQPVVTGLSIDKNQTQVTISNLPSVNSVVFSIFDEIAKENLNVDMISIITSDDFISVSFTIVEEKKESLNRALEKLYSSSRNMKIEYHPGFTKLSIVGIGMRLSFGVASRFFKAMESIPINLVTTSEIKISCLIRESDEQKAVIALSKEFEL
jgi:aspartate kinase